MSVETSEQDTGTATDNLTTTAIVTFWAIVVLGAVYAGFGLVYAMGASVDRAGITGFGNVVAFGGQVLLWPLLAAR